MKAELTVAAVLAGPISLAGYFGGNMLMHNALVPSDLVFLYPSYFCSCLYGVQLFRRWMSRPSGLFYWLGTAVMFTSMLVGLRQRFTLSMIALVLLFLDWWWRGPGRRQRKQLAATVIKMRSALAWGVPAPSTTAGVRNIE